jgi:hypothetical protein
VISGPGAQQEQVEIEAVRMRCNASAVSAFSVEDLFTAGVGLDFAGAFLISRGLLDKPERMLERAATYYNTSYVELERMAEDRVDAQAGFAVLLLGLVAQLVGYSSVLAGRHAGSGNSRVAVAILAGVLAGALAAVVWHRTRPAYAAS